jgi:hypothetical protein
MRAVVSFWEGAAGWQLQTGGVVVACRCRCVVCVWWVGGSQKEWVRCWPCWVRCRDTRDIPADQILECNCEERTNPIRLLRHCKVVDLTPKLRSPCHWGQEGTFVVSNIAVLEEGATDFSTGPSFRKPTPGHSRRYSHVRLLMTCISHLHTQRGVTTSRYCRCLPSQAALLLRPQ